MPRDLSAEHNAANPPSDSENVWKGFAQLERSPEEVTQTYSDSPSMRPKSSTPPPSEAVKPYVQSLTPLDLDSCLVLEEATFPPHERCSRDKFLYRFTKCGELSLGLFTSADTTLAVSDTPSNPHPGSASTAPTAVPVYSGTPARKSVLLGHVIATKTTNPSVRDEDMALPADWEAEHARSVASPSVASPKPASSSPSRDGAGPGHKEHGRTLIIHSMAILPEFQGRGLGRLLMRSYIQRMQGSGVADRIAIIAHEGLVPWYEGLGFESRGESEVTWGDGGWVGLSLDLRGRGD